MKTIPQNEFISQAVEKAAERADKEYYEQFRQECLDRLDKKRVAKEQKDKEAEQPVTSADN